MAKELLSPETQFDLTVDLYRKDFFGIQENPDKYTKLKNERFSPHYFNIRPGISDVEARDLIIMSMLELAFAKANLNLDNQVRELQNVYDHIAGTPEAMTSYAAMMAMQTEMSLLQPRVDLAKASGNKMPILGRYNQGDKVAEFDDVVTDGKSKIDTIKGLGHAGLVVADYFVVVDREEGGASQVLAETGLEITPALGVSGMVKILEAERLITQTQYDNVREYITQYGDPHAKQALGVSS